MAEPVCSVLFLRTGNSARSIIAEALMNYWGKGRFRAYSAGSDPTGKVNPFALDVLRQMNMAVEAPRSKSCEEFAFSDTSPHESMDFIITVCDKAAGEVCPVWPGHPLTAHWGVPDPASVEGSHAEKTRAFRGAFETLQVRIKRLVELPIEQLGTDVLNRRLKGIGTLHGSEAA